MRSLGEFFGHIAKAVKTDPAKKTKTVSKTVEEEQRGDLTLRRTTIEEIEIHDTDSPDR
jgi:hypothetical protein